MLRKVPPRGTASGRGGRVTPGASPGLARSRGEALAAHEAAAGAKGPDANRETRAADHRHWRNQHSGETKIPRRNWRRRSGADKEQSAARELILGPQQR